MERSKAVIVLKVLDKLMTSSQDHDTALACAWEMMCEEAGFNPTAVLNEHEPDFSVYKYMVGESIYSYAN